MFRSPDHPMSYDDPMGYDQPMGPVWRLIKGEKDMCHRCGKEIVDYPAVGYVVDFQFHPEQKFCWECYRYIQPFVDDVAPESDNPFQPVTKPAIP
jgi:hypothetical protein